MFNPIQKIGKKITKSFGGGGNHGRRLSSIGMGETELQQEDSRHTTTGAENQQNTPNSPHLYPANHEDKGIVQQISSGMEHFFKAIVDNPKPLPVRTTLPEDEEDDEEGDGTGRPKKEPESDVVLDETTPVPILLARIQYLETNLRAETLRAQGLEEQIMQLEAKFQELERIRHASLLSKVMRPFRACFGGAPPVEKGFPQHQKY